MMVRESELTLLQACDLQMGINLPSFESSRRKGGKFF
jgi:hypothetical protein